MNTPASSPSSSPAPARVSRVSRRAAIALIRTYRAVLSPLLGSNCRFAPTCSQYAEEAIARYGVARGAWRATRRLLRCHPWNPGGWDPVA